MTTLLVLIVVFGGGAAVGWLGRLAAENVGERLVRKRLTAEFAPDGAHLMNNVTVAYGDGTTQIDHILFSRRGIFVIETKHYAGWIFASENSKSWTQVIYKVRNSFQNPLRQNYAHCAAVRMLLDFLPPDNVKTAVVFTGDAQFKTRRPVGVFSLPELITHIRTFPPNAISENRLQFCVGRMECKRLALTWQTDVEHRARLENRFRP